MKIFVYLVSDIGSVGVRIDEFVELVFLVHVCFSSRTRAKSEVNFAFNFFEIF